MKFRKLPSVVDAFQWDPKSPPVGGLPAGAFLIPTGKLCIHTKDGTITAEKGDWILLDDNGGFAAVKPAAFEAGYERVE